MLEMNLRALGKINLGLDVLRRREDGYHEVRMVMQTVHLCDEVFLKRTKEPGIRVRTNLYYLPENENNLAYKAAKLLREEFSISEGVSISLRKHIPVAAGMAGGSSDAAAVLFGMNRMFRLGLSQEELMKRGVKLGADVPYCIMRGTALAEGIGEILTPLPPMQKCSVALAKPPVSLSTRFIYENLKLDEATVHPDIDGLLSAIEQKNLKDMAGRMGNVLETVAIPHYPVIGEIKKAMLEQGALGAMMSGSGPTVFGLFEEKGAAKAAVAAIRKKGLARQLYLTNMFNNYQQRDR